MMNIEINGKNIRVKLYENSSAEAVRELLKKGPFTDPDEGLCAYGKVRELWNGPSRQ